MNEQQIKEYPCPKCHGSGQIEETISDERQAGSAARPTSAVATSVAVEGSNPSSSTISSKEEAVTKHRLVALQFCYGMKPHDALVNDLEQRLLTAFPVAPNSELARARELLRRCKIYVQHWSNTLTAVQLAPEIDAFLRSTEQKT